MYNASSRKDVRRMEKAAQKLEAERKGFIRGAMSLAQGRAWFYHLLSFCHVFTTTFANSPTHSAFNEGERNVGLLVYRDILNYCPDLFLRMMQEAHERELAQNVQHRHDDPGDAAEPANDPVDSILDDDPSGDTALEQLDRGPQS